MLEKLESIANLQRYPLHKVEFRDHCRGELHNDGALVMPQFLHPSAVESIRQEGESNKHLAFFTEKNHNIYLTDPDPDYPASHPRNREVVSSKGCITADQIPDRSALWVLYNSSELREFLCAVLDEQALYEYADRLSSINLHYASEGQELGWHYDNSSFAITLLIRKPERGGEFDFVKDVRSADNGEMNYALSGKILDGEIPATRLTMGPGALVLFRGRNSMHRVTPTEGDLTRMLVVLAYNSEPGISLSASAQRTFYGRTG
jgi:hypothetical protein